MKFLVSTFCILLPFAQLFSQTVNFTVFADGSSVPISPYIYGANPEFTASENLAARRIGGNRLTGYNWENNASHAGTDWYNNNDNYLASGLPNPNSPGTVLKAFHDKALAVNAYPLVTLQMAGYVARDKNGTSVSQAETAPSARWRQVQFAKGTTFSLAPDTTDNFVYMDECVNFLISNYGQANTSNGIKGYELDNEPALWSSTHPRIHPSQPTCQEVTQNGIALANAVKNVDPYAEIFGPVLYGFAAYTNFQSATDWSAVSSGKGYDWFIDYYLDEMKKAETTYGRRIFDVLDIHWYPEAYGNSGGGRITDTSANNANEKAARLQAPRTLWDSHYGYSTTDPKVGENSWVAQWGSDHLPLIPKLIASINNYYPGTKLAFTEFTYGGERDITGGIATADVLGIFGKYGVYFATFWPGNINTSYVQAAYRIFRNYDGSHSTFGDLSIPARTSDSVNTSIYASAKTGTNEIHLVVINKNLTNGISGSFSVSGSETITSGNAWVLTGSGTAISNAGNISSISSNTFSYTLPAGSVSHIMLQTSDTFAGPGQPDNLPTRLTLFAYPNPFNSSCKIDYTLPDIRHYQLYIFDMLGRTVKTYDLTSQYGSVFWDGTNSRNQGVASGVYCAIIKGGVRQVIARRVVLVK